MLAEAGYPIDDDVDLQLRRMAGWSNLSAEVKAELLADQPLFFYMLRESGVVNGGQRLGPTASAVLMEVFGGVLLKCDATFISADWSPAESVVGADHELTLADILRYVDVYNASRQRPSRKRKTVKKRSTRRS